ncbi:hypothetical protein F8M41_011566 [Gigaspora margarita]|uniref:Uncharacterized protein n=1 Tax=Gigaspora margarita TaxID=4874 RepID=A0A8H3X267_GIGMA|nr:hypothetical protein F8M41_011566 [Gigaspora margarita]
MGRKISRNRKKIQRKKYVYWVRNENRNKGKCYEIRRNKPTNKPAQARDKSSLVLITVAMGIQTEKGTNRRKNIPTSTRQEKSRLNNQTSLEKKKIEEFIELKVGFHNINRIKNNSYRLQELVDFGIIENFNLLGIVKTSIDDKQEKYIKIDRSQ